MGSLIQKYIHDNIVCAQKKYKCALMEIYRNGSYSLTNLKLMLLSLSYM